MSPDNLAARKVLYCTGLWFVNNNQKRDRQHYVDYLPKTLEMLAHCDLLPVMPSFIS